MKKISTHTFFLKMFPFLFFGFLAFFFFFLLINGAFEKSPMFLVAVGFMTVIGVYYTKSSLQAIVDEVYDGGDFLLVKKGKEEDRISLSNIINVDFSLNVKPSRISLTLAMPGKFGSEISFAPPPQIYLSPLPKSHIADDLIVRADKARRVLAAATSPHQPPSASAPMR